MAYTALGDRAPRLPESALNGTDLSNVVRRFLRQSCQDLRFDGEKARREADEGVFLGCSLRPGQIPYNMQMDLDRLCLENAALRFLDSGTAADAFDVYFCYLEMFVGDYQKTRRMVELLSEYEANGSSLLMKHRDHYSHSVYVFLLGLAVYETSAPFRRAYGDTYRLAPGSAAACHFLEQWGLTALFHDIGYPFELPYEQVAAYFEVGGVSRSASPFIAYRGLEPFSRLDPRLREEAAALYGAAPDSAEALLAHHATLRLGADYGFTAETLQAILLDKPTHPERFSHFMDHAWFSAVVLLRNLFETLERPLSLADMDALTAILLHNSLYKFSVARYRAPDRRPSLRMEQYPLAYLLMLCDELQCWDRTAYGRNSRTELHPMGCRLTFAEGCIRAVYVFDREQREKLDLYLAALADWQAAKPAGDAGEDELRRWKKAKPRLKACSDMLPGESGEKSSFLLDIESIVDTSPLGLETDLTWEPRQQASKHTYLSDSSFLNLYQFAVSLNGRWMLGEDWQAIRDSAGQQRFLQAHAGEFEAAFGTMSLEYKLSNVNQAKAFDGYLNAIGCFYTDRPVDFPFLERFTPEDMAKISPMEHHRWLREHITMGWHYGEPASRGDRELRRLHRDMIPDEAFADGTLSPEASEPHFHTLSTAEQDKDVEAMNTMLALLRSMGGVRMYRYMT